MHAAAGEKSGILTPPITCHVPLEWAGVTSRYPRKSAHPRQLEGIAPRFGGPSLRVRHCANGYAIAAR